MKKIRIILLFIIIILIICLIALVNLKRTKKPIIEFNKSVDIPDIEIKNYTNLARIYGGKEKIRDFDDKVKEIAKDFLPELYIATNKMDSDKLNKYFEENKLDIIKKIGIDNSSDFQNLITLIRKVAEDEFKITDIEVDLSDYIEDENYAKFKIVFLNANGVEMKFNAFLNMKNNPSKYIKLIPEV